MSVASVFCIGYDLDAQVATADKGQLIATTENAIIIIFAVFTCLRLNDLMSEGLN